MQRKTKQSPNLEHIEKWKGANLVQLQHKNHHRRDFLADTVGLMSPHWRPVPANDLKTDKSNLWTINCDSLFTKATSKNMWIHNYQSHILLLLTLKMQLWKLGPKFFAGRPKAFLTKSETCIFINSSWNDFLPKWSCGHVDYSSNNFAGTDFFKPFLN